MSTMAQYVKGIYPAAYCKVEDNHYHIVDQKTGRRLGANRTTPQKAWFDAYRVASAG